MSVEIIDPNYQWKQAASQEGVDYGAVQKSFMDQSYAVVANKAKILFQDPFRLGFEIVHRNEKATKMVGIYAFRVNGQLLYAPVFFVNGEIKAADMLYRADVKRFVPLTEDWCAYLVRGVHENAGEPIDRNRFRQADAYMDRLAYPQRVKYASEDEERTAMLAEFRKAAADGSLWADIMLHCADNTPLRKLLPLVINEHGPEALEKVAAFVENSPTAARYLATRYTREELQTVDGWMAKEASGPRPAIQIITSPTLAKSAASRERVFDKGYDLVDSRPAESINTVIEEVGDGTIKGLSAPGKVQVLMGDGEMVEALLLRQDSSLLRENGYPTADPDILCKPEYVYFPKDKQLLKLNYDQDIFGDEMIDQDTSAKAVTAESLASGKCYVALNTERLTISDPFRVDKSEDDGECSVISITTRYGDTEQLLYAPGRGETAGNYISDETFFLEVECDVENGDSGEIRSVKPTCNKVLMTSRTIDQWFRTAGGLTTAHDVTVKSNGVSFDVEHRENGTLLKAARNLGWLETHLALAEDFSISTDKAGEILDKAIDRDVSYRIYDTLSKKAYITRPEGMQQWIQSYDPELQVQMDAPQIQTLSTHTPERPRQQQRYGDVYKGPRSENRKTADALIPMDAIMNQSPEELAQMSDAYDLPHIFDHGCVGQMSTNNYSIIEQIKQYIPDLEAGVDRLFRILFLLRYRPADFEELYGKDDLVAFEQELADLATRSGDNLLRMLQRFDPDQYAAQEN
jgi:hypothetical protein